MRRPTIRTVMPLLFAAIVGALAVRGAAAQESGSHPAQGAAPNAAAAAGAPAKAPHLLSPEELRKKCRYVASDFEMDVNPPIDAGDGVIVEAMKYASPVESRDPERNDVVRARLFRVAEPTRAAVIALGGWKFDPLTPELARDLAKSGIQVVWIEVPYQGQRTPKGSRPGDLTLSDDLEQNEKTFVQLAQDVGRMRSWLIAERKIDPERIGLLGTSLGGFAAATLYGMEHEYKAVTVQIAGSDVAAVLFNGNWLTRRIESGLRERGIDVGTARELLRGMNPATWADPDRGDGVLLVAAELDEIVPLHTVEDLRDRYRSAHFVLMEGAPHRAAEGLRAALPKVREHFERLLLDRTAPNPGK